MTLSRIPMLACGALVPTSGLRRAAAVVAAAAILAVVATATDAAEAARHGSHGAAPKSAACGSARVRDENVSKGADSRAARAAIREQASAARKWLAERFGALRHQWCPKLLTIDLQAERPGDERRALTGAMTRRGGAWRPVTSGRFGACVTRISRSQAGRSDQLLLGLLTHEAVHCYQAEAMGVRRFLASSPWLREGSAAYASWAHAGAYAPHDMTDRWRTYATQPERSLYARDYDAAGFFEHLERHTKHRWRVIARMWRAWRGRSIPVRDDAAFAVARRAGGGAGFVRAWATGFARRGDWGPEWDMQGTGLPSNAEASAVPTPLALQSGDFAKTDFVDEAAVRLFNIMALPGSVVSVRGEGTGKLRLFDTQAPDLQLDGDFQVDYCVLACQCPDGSDLAASMPTAPNGLAVAAFSNGADTGMFEAQIIAPPCPPPTFPPPPEPTCSPTPASAGSPALHAAALSRPASVASHEPCTHTPHPCDWGFGVPEITAWMLDAVDDRHPVEKVAGGRHDDDETIWGPKRGCLWTDSWGDLVSIDEFHDNAALRAHLDTLDRVPVADEGWVQIMSSHKPPDRDVFFRVGGRIVRTALWTHCCTDPDEAIAFANAVAAAVPAPRRSGVAAAEGKPAATQPIPKRDTEGQARANDRRQGRGPFASWSTAAPPGDLRRARAPR
jgi:hypothetical protein